VDAQKLILVQHRQIYRELHEFLKETDPQARLVLPKMNAESSLCSNLLVAFVIILPPLVMRHGWFSVSVIWSALALAVCLYASFYRTRRSIERHFSFFALVVLDVEKSKSASA
jgi:uncharacterized membrane protein YobD (UPF0266 family)